MNGEAIKRTRESTVEKIIDIQKNAELLTFPVSDLIMKEDIPESRNMIKKLENAVIIPTIPYSAGVINLETTIDDRKNAALPEYLNTAIKEVLLIISLNEFNVL